MRLLAGKKLRSQRGASLSAALLLFLVCTVVASIVIVAGTTAAGRMSELAYMDQRYYAVNSAAELLCGQFSQLDQGGQSVTVVLTKDETFFENLESGVVSGTGDDPVYEGSIELSSGVPWLVQKIVTSATGLSENSGSISELQWDATTPCTNTVNVTATVVLSGHDETEVEVGITSKDDGTIVLDVHNVANENRGVYHLYVTLASDFDISEDSDDEYAGTSSSQMTIHSITTKTTVMRWYVSSMTHSQS